MSEQNTVEGSEYPYSDKTREENAAPATVTEAGQATLNPAYHLKDEKPEAMWNEAEKNDQAESANDVTSPEAPGVDDEAEVPEEMSDQAAEERKAEYTEMAKKDEEAGTAIASPDPEKARSAEDDEQKAAEQNEADEPRIKGRIGGRRKSS